MAMMMVATTVATTVVMKVVMLVVLLDNMTAAVMAEKLELLMVVNLVLMMVE